MMSNDDATRHGSITWIFHWGMALLIGWQMLKFLPCRHGEHWVGQTLVP
jgi:cytochrome b561